MRSLLRRTVLFSTLIILTSGVPAGEPAEDKSPTRALALAESVNHDGLAGWERRQEYARMLRGVPADGDLEKAMANARDHRSRMEAADTRAGTAASSLQSVPGNAWSPIGPAPMEDFKRSNDVSGRVRAIAIDPGDSTGQTIYIGGAMGGVWKTVNGGGDWKPLTDSLESISIGDIKLDPQNSQIVYVGTGELATSIDGAGVFRSDDGGVSWTQQGRSAFGASPSGGDYVAAIAIDPTPVGNPLLYRTLHVATKDGIYRSTESGQSWNPALTNCAATDVIVDPVIPSTVYAACKAGGIYRSETSGSPGSYVRQTDLNHALPLTGFGRVELAAAAGTGGSTVLYASMQDSGRFGRELKGIWMSTDRGTRWSRVTGHPPQFATGGIVGNPDVLETEPNDTRAQADLVAPGDVADGSLITSADVDYYRIQPVGNVVNVEIVAGRTGTGLDPRLVLYDKNGVKIREAGSGNAGSNDERITLGWVEVTPGENHYVKVESSNGTSGDYQISFLGIDLWCQCEYDQVITVDPDDSSIVYMGAVRLYRSRDGGVNWNQIQDHDDGYNWIHQDIHVIVPDRARPGRIYVGSDGGVFVSDDYGDTWGSLNTNLSLTQPVYIAQHPTDPDFMLLGSQDNGVASYDGSDWTTVTGGDGAACAIVSDLEWYYSTNNLWMIKTDDGGISYKHPKNWFNGLYRDRVLLYAQFVVHPVSTGHLIAGGGRSEATGQKHYVYRSEDRGENWTANSQHLGATIHKVAIAKTDLDVAYAGLSNGKVFGTTDRGATDWVEQTVPGRPNSIVNDLEVDPTDEDTVYVTYGGYGHAHIFRTTNGGISWAAVGNWPPAGPGDMPDLPVYSIAVDPTYPDTLFVGTDLGIYRSEDGGVTWKTYDHGLPNVRVRDLILSATTGPVGKLRAGTYGRGVWELGFGNDDCDDAIPIGDGTEYGTTTAAGTDGTASCGSSNSTPDVWYRYTSTCDGQLAVDTCGSSYDTVVSVHGPVCPGSSATEEACNDDCYGGSCGTGTSCVTVPTEIGAEHLIRVGGFNNHWGNFALTTGCSVPNDDCPVATSLTVPASVLGSTRSATIDTVPVCGGITPDSPGVWYTVIGGGNLITASLCSTDTDYDSRLSVYCAGCGGQTCVGADDDACGARSEVTWCAAAGQSYHILVHGKTATGQFRLDLSGGASCSLAVSCAPSNDLCENGTPIGNTSPGSVIGDNTGVLYPDDLATCATSTGDVYFDYAPPCQGWSTVDTCPALGDLADTVVSVLGSCGGDEIACNDDHPDCSPRSKLTIPVEADRSYKVRVASYGSSPDPGLFPLSIGQTLAPLAIPPAGLYVTDGAGTYEDHLFRLDLVDRSAMIVGPLYEQGLTGMVYAPNLSTMYGVNDEIDDDDMVTVNLHSGEVLPFGPVGFSTVRGLAWDPITLTLYGVDTFTEQLIKIDPYTGAGTAVGILGYTDVQGLAFDPTTGTLYGADDNTDKLIVIDPSTGAGADVGWFGAGMDGMNGLTFDTDRNVLYGIRIDTGATSQVVRIDTGTGRATALPGSYPDVGSDALAFVAGLPYATREAPYDERLPVGGGCPDYFFGNYSGLPEGVEGSPEGRISGIPADLGNYLVVFSVGDTDLGSPEVGGEYLLRVRPGNDDCDARYPAGDGLTPFETINALTDGPDEPAQCLSAGYSQVGSDVWYCYQATCTGELGVDLCDADYDTKVAVYEGCACPSVESAVACNDDQCGIRSQLLMPVTAGNDYLIRVGGYDEARGVGFLALACDGAPGGACCLPGGCFLLTEEQCAAQDGGYAGDGTNCGADADGDGLSDPCDGCPGDPNKFDPGVCGCGSLEHDSDGDGWFDCEDCDPGFANTHADAPESNDGVDNQCAGEPGHGLVDEITGIAGFFVPDSKDLFSWPAQTGASHYEVARAEDPEFTIGCALFEFVDPEWNDFDYPMPGNGFYYLVRARYPHTGSWGADSSGTERTSICP